MALSFGQYMFWQVAFKSDKKTFSFRWVKR